MRSALRRDCGLEIAVSLMEKIYGRRVSQFKEAALLESHQGMCKQRKNKQQWCSEDRIKYSTFMRWQTLSGICIRILLHMQMYEI